MLYFSHNLSGVSVGVVEKDSREERSERSIEFYIHTVYFYKLGKLSKLQRHAKNVNIKKEKLECLLMNYELYIYYTARIAR